MYRIYLNEVSLIVAEQVPEDLESYQLLEEKGFNLHNFFQQKCASNLPESYVLRVSNVAQFFTSIKSCCLWIEAAGGLVFNDQGACLFIYRRGKWDLPKGKIDAGEQAIEAAQREVEEECGVRVSRVRQLLSETYHVYEMQGELVLKKTYWYAMEVSGSPHLVPQQEEGITQVCWLQKNELAAVKANTYPLILDLVHEQFK